MVISFEDMNSSPEQDAGGTLVKGADVSKWAHENTRIFLDKIDVRAADLKKNTLYILRDRHNIKIPNIGEQLRIRTQTQVNLLSILLCLLHKHSSFDKLYIASYTLNKESLKVLVELLKKGKIASLKVFLSSSYSFRNPEYYRYLKETFIDLKENFDVSLVFANLHLKITLVKCGKNFYQFEGSMNYSTNNMAEQLVFENSEETFRHDVSFFEEILQKKEIKALEIVV